MTRCCAGRKFVVELESGASVGKVLIGARIGEVGADDALEDDMLCGGVEESPSPVCNIHGQGMP